MMSTSYRTAAHHMSKLLLFTLDKHLNISLHLHLLQCWFWFLPTSQHCNHLNTHRIAFRLLCFMNFNVNFFSPLHIHFCFFALWHTEIAPIIFARRRKMYSKFSKIFQTLEVFQVGKYP